MYIYNNIKLNNKYKQFFDYKIYTKYNIHKLLNC